MQTSFPRALSLVLIHEGGYSDHAKDTGGKTNYGVTARVYDAFRSRRGKAVRSVKNIEPDEVAAIYRLQYWNAIRGDDLSTGVDNALFDLAVNSGPAKAIKVLQEALGVKVDGVIGDITLLRAAHSEPANLIRKICSIRMSFLHRLWNWSTFGKGWASRVRDVQTASLAMI